MSARLGERPMRALLAAFGALTLAIGLWLAISPASFAENVAPYPDAGDHFLRDLGTYNIALGMAFLVAVGRPTWRAPVLFFAAAQATIHAVNHLIDIGDTDPGWLGPVNFAAIGLIAVLLWWLFAVGLGARQRDV